MSKVDIVFVDIDMTLYDNSLKKFDNLSINALKTLQNKGILVYVSTARPFESVEHMGLLKLFKPNGLICNNGGVIFSNNELILSNVIPPKLVEETISICNSYNLEVEWCTPKERFFSIEKNEYVDRYFDFFNDKYLPVRKYNGEEVNSLLLMCPKSFDDELKRKLSNKLEYLRFVDYGVDIRYIRNNKGFGVDAVLKHHKLSFENALSIGDDIPDVFMFRSTKYSACLSNGCLEAKNSAVYVAKSVKENGVLDAIKHFNLI